MRRHNLELEKANEVANEAKASKLKEETILLQEQKHLQECENKLKLYEVFTEKIKSGMNKKKLKRTFPGMFPDSFYLSDDESDYQ